jgi:hypothetical protein
MMMITTKTIIVNDTMELLRLSLAPDLPPQRPLLFLGTVFLFTYAGR